MVGFTAFLQFLGSVIVATLLMYPMPFILSLADRCSSEFGRKKFHDQNSRNIHVLLSTK